MPIDQEKSIRTVYNVDYAFTIRPASDCKIEIDLLHFEIDGHAFYFYLYFSWKFINGWNNIMEIIISNDIRKVILFSFEFSPQCSAWQQ